MTEYRPTSKCPNCSRRPNVSFSEDQVRQAKRERQAAHVVNVQCPRCRTRYWIRAREIAGARQEGPLGLPGDFPAREELVRAGLTTIEAVAALEDLTAIPGIGPAKAKLVLSKLDTMRGRAVA